VYWVFPHLTTHVIFYSNVQDDRFTTMSEHPPKPEQTPEAETADIMRLIEEYRAKDAAGAFEHPKRSYKEVRSWRDAWIFSFYLAHLDHTDFMLSEHGVVRCVVWPAQQFNDKLINTLGKIASQIGPDKDLKELRLIETEATPAGIQKLREIAPNASIKLFTHDEAKKDKRIEYVNTDIEWIKKIQQQ
jgi:hypothetical protein